MEKSVKIVLILGIVFLVVILSVGPKLKTALLPKEKHTASPAKLEPSMPKERTVKFSSDELQRIDEMIGEVERKKSTATASQARSLDELKRILEMTKAKGRPLSQEELSSLVPKSAPEPEEATLSPPLPEGVQPPLPEGLSPEEGLEWEEPFLPETAPPAEHDVP